MTPVDEVERIADVIQQAVADVHNLDESMPPVRREWLSIDPKIRKGYVFVARAVLSALFEGDSRRRSAGEPVTEIV